MRFDNYRNLYSIHGTPTRRTSGSSSAMVVLTSRSIYTLICFTEIIEVDHVSSRDDPDEMQRFLRPSEPDSQPRKLKCSCERWVHGSYRCGEKNIYRRGDGAAERAGLENRRPRKGSASSNLAPSASPAVSSFRNHPQALKQTANIPSRGESQ